MLAECGSWDEWAAPKLKSTECFDTFSVVTISKQQLVQVRYELNDDVGLIKSASQLWQPSNSSPVASAQTRSHDVGLLLHRSLLSEQTTNLSHLSVPVSSALNRRIWRNLEKYELSAAQKKGAVEVVNGVITDDGQTITALYKILVHQRSRAHIAFVVPNLETLSEDITQYVTTIDCIEQQTGFEVIKKPREYKDWALSLAYGLDVWTQGGNTYVGDCPALGKLHSNPRY